VTHAGHGVARTSRWAAAVGVLALLANEFFWRDFFLPHLPSMTQVWIALGGEWLALLLLLALWLPRVEHRGLASIGVTRFRWSYIWMGAGAYAVTFVVVVGVEFLQHAAGQETIRDLQPTLATYPWPLLIALFITGTVLEEVVYRGTLTPIKTNQITAANGQPARLCMWLLGSNIRDHLQRHTGSSL
jgi:membrane protease YdiL (CAAX protease family)